ncbi:MAG: AAA family ATPase [Betaproteobacteria bacterium]|nr:AAA family ATPase [Betaproteobacteria bacterium]
MHLKKLKITNYKSFLHPTEFAFEPGFNVLLGANSSGKTSVLEAIAYYQLQNIPHRSVLNVLDTETILTDSSTTEVEFELAIHDVFKHLPSGTEVFIGIGEQAGHFYTTDANTVERRLKQESISLSIKHNPHQGQFSRLHFSNWPSDWRPVGGNSTFSGFRLQHENPLQIQIANYSSGTPELTLLNNRIQQKIYRFSAERAIRPTSSAGGDELQPDCSNLAFCISQLQNRDHVAADILMRLLNRVFPSIYRVSAPSNSNHLFELRVQTTPTDLRRSDLTVPINQVGTGVGNALAMLYVALTAQSQRFILLEEPNSFLHPRALRELLAILAEIGSKHQFFITTHSSDVLRTVKASTVTLLEYFGQQTTVKQTSGGKLHELRAGLIDLGISFTDLHGCDRVLWVEGETEAAIFPLVLQHFFPELAQGIAVLPLHATGDFESRKFEPKKVAAIYRKLSEGSFLAPPMVGITLDREKKSDSQIKQIESDCDGVVHFLPRTMLEDYLLDAEAIASVLTSMGGSQITAVQVDNQLQIRAPENNSCLLNPANRTSKTLHAAKVLEFVFTELSQREYRKTDHGPKLTQWLIDNKPEALDDLKVWFQTFINSA